MNINKLLIKKASKDTIWLRAKYGINDKLNCRWKQSWLRKKIIKKSTSMGTPPVLGQSMKPTLDTPLVRLEYEINCKPPMQINFARVNYSSRHHICVRAEYRVDGWVPSWFTLVYGINGHKNC